MVKLRICLKKNDRGDWLTTMLRTKFFEHCVLHKDVPKNERNVFCINCSMAYCLHCVTSPCHRSHSQLQIYKYVYHDVVRHQDIEKHFDCSKIQKYKINGEKAVHLNARPQSEGSKGSTKAKYLSSCETCGRALQDQPNCFCSIACKIAVDSSLNREDENKSIMLPHQESGLALTEDSNPTKSVIGIQSSSGTSFKRQARRHRRKGIPHRAPLF